MPKILIEDYVAAIILTTMALAITLLTPHEPNPIRLIGKCDGQYYGQMDEDEFPQNCEWIEAVREEN